MCKYEIEAGLLSSLSVQIDSVLACLEKKNSKEKRVFMDDNAEVSKHKVALLHKLQAPMDQGEHNTCTSFSIAYCIAHTLCHLYGSDFSITQEQLVSYILRKCGSWGGCRPQDLLQKIKTMICDDDSVWFSNPSCRLRFDINWTVYHTCTAFVDAIEEGIPMPCVAILNDEGTIEYQDRHSVSVWGVDGAELDAHNSWGADNRPSVDVHCHFFVQCTKIALHISHVLDGHGEPMPVPIIRQGCIAVFVKWESEMPLPVLAVRGESGVKQRK